LFKIEQEVPYFYVKKVRFYENVSFTVPSFFGHAFYRMRSNLDRW